MYNGRPVYRMTRVSIGNWSAVYADTGEVLPRMGREQALKWMKQFAPEYASTMTYDAYLESPDEFTRIPTLAGYVPLHRIAMNDAAGTEYYVSEKSNDIVQKTDRGAAFSPFPAMFFTTSSSFDSALGGHRCWISSPGPPCSWWRPASSSESGAWRSSHDSVTKVFCPTHPTPVG
jgi:hypothetical protein